MTPFYVQNLYNNYVVDKYVCVQVVDKMCVKNYVVHKYFFNPK